MQALYRMYKLVVKRSFETRIDDKGTEKKFTGLENWKFFRDSNEKIVGGFEFTTDEKGVAIATYRDVVGNHYKEIREDVLKTMKPIKTYQTNDKIEYYKNRVNSTWLTASQREFAKNRLKALTKSK